MKEPTYPITIRGLTAMWLLAWGVVLGSIAERYHLSELPAALLVTGVFHLMSIAYAAGRRAERSAT